MREVGSRMDLTGPHDASTPAGVVTMMLQASPGGGLQVVGRVDVAAGKLVLADVGILVEGATLTCDRP